MKKIYLVCIAFVVLLFLSSTFVYEQMPDKMASHWGIDGKVNGYMDKFTGLFLLPTVSLILFAFLVFLPKLDPLKKNYISFQKEFDSLILLFIVFMFYIHLLAIGVNFGYSLNVSQFLAPAFGVLFYYIGVVIGKAKQNWFVGIRTPWTLSSKTVWNKTHKICGKMLRAAGIVALIGIVFPNIGLVASVGVVVATAIFSIVYSYLEFQKEKKN